jgi:hypothetical protein
MMRSCHHAGRAGGIGVGYAPQRMRFSCRLADASRDTHILSERLDRDLIDISALQDEISAMVTSAIEPKLVAAKGLRAEASLPTGSGRAGPRRAWPFALLEIDSIRERVAIYVPGDGTPTSSNSGLARMIDP